MSRSLSLERQRDYKHVTSKKRSKRRGTLSIPQRAQRFLLRTFAETSAPSALDLNKQDVRAPSLNTQLPAAGKATGSWANCFRGERLKREQATADERCRRALRCGPGCPRQLFYVGPAFAFLCVPVQRDLRNLDQVQVVPLQAVTFFVRDLQIPMDMLVTVIKSDFEALATG